MRLCSSYRLRVLVSPTNSEWISGLAARVGLNICIYRGLCVSSDAVFHTKVKEWGPDLHVKREDDLPEFWYRKFMTLSLNIFFYFFTFLQNYVCISDGMV